jgi:acyl carrier protein
MNTIYDNDVIAFLNQYVPDASTDSLDIKMSDLGIDSIDMVSMVCDIEEEYGVEINFEKIDLETSLRSLIKDITNGAEKVVG